MTGASQPLVRLVAGQSVIVGGDRVVEVDETLASAISTLLDRNEPADARVRITLSRGAGEEPVPTLLITVTPFEPYPERLYREGASLLVSPYRLNETSPLAGYKTANYLLNLRAREEARVARADDALLLNTRGEVAEASVANVFMVSEDGLVTPCLDTGVLPGITRAIVLKLAGEEGILSVAEKRFGLSALLEADEAFMTNSLMEVVPVTRINGRPVGAARPGATTYRLARRYRELVAAECGSPPFLMIPQPT